MYQIGSNGVLTSLSTPTVPTDYHSQAIAINPAGTYAYVANAGSFGLGAGTITMYAIGSDGVLSPLSIASVATADSPSGLTINDAGTYAYVSNGGIDTVSIYAIGSNGVLTLSNSLSLPSSSSPMTIVLSH
jgi:DNA-binding beta-propeller fold protein YncE